MLPLNQRDGTHCRIRYFSLPHCLHPFVRRSLDDMIPFIISVSMNKCTQTAKQSFLICLWFCYITVTIHLATKQYHFQSSPFTSGTLNQDRHLKLNLQTVVLRLSSDDQTCSNVKATCLKKPQRRTECGESCGEWTEAWCQFPAVCEWVGATRIEAVVVVNSVGLWGRAAVFTLTTVILTHDGSSGF